MLTRLSPDKISEAWPMVYRAIKASSISLADMTEDRVNNVLRSLMTGHATCWIHERESTITTLIITTITHEPISKTLNLLVYCAGMFAKVKPDEYIKMAKGLGEYAKGVGCSQVILYCSNNKLTELLKSNGALATYTLVVFPLL